MRHIFSFFFRFPLVKKIMHGCVAIFHILKEIHCILPRISEPLNVYFTVYCTFYQRYPLNSGWSLSQQS